MQDKMAVMNMGVRDQLAWQLSNETVDEAVNHNYRRVNADEININHGSVYMITLGLGKCVAYVSQGSCPKITNMQGR